MHVALAGCRPLPDIPDVELIDAPLHAALTARRIEVSRPAWDDATVDWSAFDAVVVRTTWDYTGNRDRFVAWAQRVAAVTRLFNPPEVLAWNTHKGYLIELEERGAPVVPTAWLGQGDRIDLAALLADRGWGPAIVKPAVAAGSDGLLRVAADDPAGQRHLDALSETGDVLVQPYLGSVEDGELSVVLFDGEVSHAVLKRPSAGEFRVQFEFGGRYEPAELPPDVGALASWIVEATGHDLLYARVDLLFADDGTPQLTELEATEPDLYWEAAPGGPDRFADAIVRRLG